jgi:hypothetical protein
MSKRWTLIHALGVLAGTTLSATDFVPFSP